MAPDALPQETRALARALLGRYLVRVLPEGTMAGRIVETEAYLPGDPACHAFNGMTPRNATLFGLAHHGYVYQIYGTSFCFNVSSEAVDVGAGVLVRALEPVAGTTLMQARRPNSSPRDLCRGPGRLCAAMAIDRGLDGVDAIRHHQLWIAHGRPVPRSRVRISPRIGVTQAASRRLRYYEAGNPFVSGPRSSTLA